VTCTAIASRDQRRHRPEPRAAFLVETIPQFGDLGFERGTASMLQINPTRIGALLAGLTGIVDEYTITEKNGIFGWSTRHPVIARRITQYKFSGAEELEKLLATVIDNLNPTEPLELQTIRAICDNEFGIGRIGDAKTISPSFG